MADFVAVATLDQLAPGHGMTVTVRGVPVALRARAREDSG